MGRDSRCLVRAMLYAVMLDNLPVLQNSVNLNDCCQVIAPRLTGSVLCWRGLLCDLWSYDGGVLSRGWREAWQKAGRPQVSLGWASLCTVMFFPLVLWHCWLGDRNDIRPVNSSVLVCWWWQFDWNFTRLIAPVVATTSVILSSNIIQNGGFLDHHLLTQVVPWSLWCYSGILKWLVV